MAGNLFPGGGGVSIADDPQRGNYQDYTTGGYQQGALSQIPLHKQIQALEDPKVVKSLLNDARSYLHEGVNQLQDIGTSGGLNAGQWSALGSIFGGNPLEGAQGWIAPKNQVHENIMQQAQAAALNNEYNKQKATASLQYGAPLATGQAAQDVANYNTFGIINAMPKPEVASNINAQNIKNQLDVMSAARKNAELAKQLGFAPVGQNVNVQGAGGQSIDAGTRGIKETPYISANVPAEQQPINYQRAQDMLKQYNSLAAADAPQVMNERLGALGKSLNGLLTADSASIPGGVKSYQNDKTLEALKQAGLTPDLIIQGKGQKILNDIGVNTPGGQAASGLMQLAHVPGFEDAAKAGLASLMNGNLDVNQLKANIEGGKRGYQQRVRSAPKMQQLLQDNKDALAFTDSPALEAQVQQRGYNKSFADDLTPEQMGNSSPEQINNNVIHTLDASGAGLAIPERLAKEKGLGLGYTADFTRYVNSLKGGTKKAVDNIAAQYRKAGLPDDQAEDKARQFWKHMSTTEYGGM